MGSDESIVAECTRADQTAQKCARTRRGGTFASGRGVNGAVNELTCLTDMRAQLTLGKKARCSCRTRSLSVWCWDGHGRLFSQCCGHHIPAYGKAAKKAWQAAHTTTATTPESAMARKQGYHCSIGCFKKTMPLLFSTSTKTVKHPLSQCRRRRWRWIKKRSTKKRISAYAMWVDRPTRWILYWRTMLWSSTVFLGNLVGVQRNHVRPPWKIVTLLFPLLQHCHLKRVSLFR